MTKYILVAISLIVVSFSQAQEDSLKNAQIFKFGEILDYVNQAYVDDIDNKQLGEAAIVAMLEKLDPHSSYISKEDVRDANERINGSFVGIGIRFQILKDTLCVVATIPNGPSEKLGIQAGDKILKIEGESVAGIGLKNHQVRERLLGEMGSKVSVDIKRGKKKQLLPFTITRDRIPVHSVDSYYMINDRTGYIKLSSFSRTTASEIDESIRVLKEQGMKNLIFDLQNNGGGLLYAAKNVADQFLSGNKMIVYSEGRKQPRSQLKAGQKGRWEDGRLVILTNENSASASEIVSGAVQDWDRGLIIGRRTFGKGLVQRPINLSDGSQLRLTIARYYTPSGRFIQKPYDDLEAYRNDYMDRYLHGELSNQDSIKFADSLKHETRITKRTVYGGGGIMPDIFVPLDTTSLSDYYKSIIRGGYINTFALTYIEKNRNELKKQYPSFAEFKKADVCSTKLMKNFFDYVKKENPELKHNENEYKTSEQLLKTRIKAVLAQDLWGISEFYQIINTENDALQVALQTIESEAYLEKNLAP
ncbi:MAG: S41 family peptidase [Bacteroidetes bacterium]|nr:MAG: S41 family peptidase [Bacteroidota bacterium]